MHKYLIFIQLFIVLFFRFVYFIACRYLVSFLFFIHFFSYDIYNILTYRFMFCTPACLLACSLNFLLLPNQNILSSHLSIHPFTPSYIHIHSYSFYSRFHVLFSLFSWFYFFFTCILHTTKKSNIQTKINFRNRS